MSYRVDFQISVDLEDDLNSAKVAIGSSKQDIAALMVATEHMMGRSHHRRFLEELVNLYKRSIK